MAVWGVQEAKRGEPRLADATHGKAAFAIRSPPSRPASQLAVARTTPVASRALTTNTRAILWALRRPALPRELWTLLS